MVARVVCFCCSKQKKNIYETVSHFVWLSLVTAIRIFQLNVYSVYFAHTDRHPTFTKYTNENEMKWRKKNWKQLMIHFIGWNFGTLMCLKWKKIDKNACSLKWVRCEPCNVFISVCWEATITARWRFKLTNQIVTKRAQLYVRVCDVYFFFRMVLRTADLIRIHRFDFPFAVVIINEAYHWWHTTSRQGTEIIRIRLFFALKMKSDSNQNWWTFFTLYYFSLRWELFFLSRKLIFINDSNIIEFTENENQWEFSSFWNYVSRMYWMETWWTKRKSIQWKL